jgi:hypothetical protein
MTITLKNHCYLWLRVTTSAAAAASNASPTTPFDLKLAYTGRPPRVANANETCFWVYDSEFDGVQKGNARIDYSPIIGSREDAIDWLKTPPGAAWISQAETYELISLATI